MQEAIFRSMVLVKIGQRERQDKDPTVPSPYSITLLLRGWEPRDISIYWNSDLLVK